VFAPRARDAPAHLYTGWGKVKLVVLLRREKRTASHSILGRTLVDPLC
jgi:hypothetical protein